jgi:hypothetical protein
LDPPDLRVDGGGGSRCVSGKLIGDLGFSHRGIFIGEGAASEVDQGTVVVPHELDSWAMSRELEAEEELALSTAEHMRPCQPILVYLYEPRMCAMSECFFRASSSSHAARNQRPRKLAARPIWSPPCPIEDRPDAMVMRHY